MDECLHHLVKLKLLGHLEVVLISNAESSKEIQRVRMILSMVGEYRLRLPLQSRQPTV